MNPEAHERGRPQTAPVRQDLALYGELSSNVVGFCRLLRRQGTGVGPGEESDALRALEQIDLGRGDAFYYGLRTTLAKSRREQQVFDDCFASYWGVWERAAELNSLPRDAMPLGEEKKLTTRSLEALTSGKIEFRLVKRRRREEP